MDAVSRAGRMHRYGTARRARKPARAVLVLALGWALALATFQSPPTTVASSRPAAGEGPAAGGPRPAAQPPGGLVDSAQGVGWTQGTFSVSDDGAAQYNLPLWVPDARGGNVAPQLALSFDSRSGNGLVGVGWSLAGLSSISWCPRTYAQDGFTEGGHFDGTNALCLGGMRLLPTSTVPAPQREYVTEHQSFARIVGYGTQDNVPDYFEVWSKDGTVQTFGQTDNSRLEAFRHQPGPDPEEPTLVRAPAGRVTLAWSVDKVEDRNGNAATVEYLRSEGDEDELSRVEMRPSVIRYEPNRRVEFAYESRTDPIESFGGGVLTRTAHRLNTISMFAGPTGGTAELLREYELSYRNNSITGRSLLTDIAECHRQPSDGEQVCKTSLPLTWSDGSYEFEEVVEDGDEDGPSDGIMAGDVDGDGADDLIYTLVDLNDDEPEKLIVRAGSRSGVQFGPPHVTEFPVDSGPNVRPVDIDFDGRAELMVSLPEDGTTRWTLYEPDGLDYKPAPGGGGLDDDGLDASFRFADLDGNGLPDFVGARNHPGTQRWYRLNTGVAGAGRFGDRIETDVPDINLEGVTASVGDTDGDGRAEIIGGESSQHLFAGWGLNAAGGVEGESLQARAGNGDVNGDGLDDLLEDRWNAEREVSELRVRRNSGNGFDSRLTIPVPDDWPGRTIRDIEDGFAAGPMRIVDVNNDGRSDILIMRNGAMRLYQWTGTEFARADDFNLADPGEGIGQNVQPMDYNGDGLMDIVSTMRVGNSDEWRVRIFKRLGDLPDQLVRIGDPLVSPTVQISYANLSDRSVHVPTEGCAYPIVCPAKGGNVVAEHRVASRVQGGDVSWTTHEHSYAGARVDLRGRRPLGFAAHTVERLGTVTLTEFDNQTREVGGTSEYAQAEVYPYANRPKKVTSTVEDSPTGRESRTIVSYDNRIRRHEAGSYTVETKVVVTTEEERPVGGSAWELLRRSRVDTDYDEFGNKVRATAATAGGRTTTEDIDYRNDETRWLIGLPTARRVIGCAPDHDCVTRKTTHDYDDNGNPTLSVVEPDSSELKLSTVTDYGEFGTIDSVTVTDDTGGSRTERYTYDADKLYATSMIDALEHETTATMHSGLGVVLETADPNGVKTTMRYDGFGRAVETNEADGSFEHLDNVAFLGLQQVTTDTAGGANTSVLLNSLGQEIEQRVRTFDGRTATVFTAYDNRGRMSTRSRPTLPGGNPRLTTYTYDNRDRLTSVTQPDGAVTRYAYVGLETHTHDPRDTHSYTVANVDGDVESRYEDDPDSAAWLRTRLAYGPFGLGTSIVAADGTTQTMRYDRLGRMDRHVDPSSGTADTSYNAFGEPVRQTNGAGEAITLRYDELGRIEQSTSPDGTATNTWDSAEHGIGYLASARSADGVVTRYTYDEFGHQETADWTVDGEAYRLDYGYDEFGRQASLTYPRIPDVQDRLRVDYTYNAHGYLQQIKNPTEPKPYWQGTARNAEGALTEERLGNDVVSTYGYEATTGRLTQAATAGPAGQLQKLNLAYDLNGNLTSKSDDVSRRVEEFEYDRLNRLLSWTVASASGQAEKHTYDYDTMGGLLSEQVDGQPERAVTYRYGENGAPPHALTSRIGDGESHTYHYDEAGRQASGPRRDVDYNLMDLPSSITWGQTQVETTYRYDADGARVRKQDTEQTVTYVGGVFERRATAGTGGRDIHNLHYIVAEGRVVAQINRVQAAGGGPVTATQRWYLHADQQGSTMVVTNSAGRRVGDDDDFLNELFYDPFGRRIDADNNPLGRGRHGGVRFGFTGHEHEDETGLLNMNGRIYDAQARRFLSPDPILQDPLSSQNHNRYSYVGNNPTTYTDPSGFQAMSGGCAGASELDCWELTTMGHADAAFPGGNFFNPSFSLTATPGLDEDSTAVTMPDEVIYVTPVDVKCNEEGTCYGQNEGRHWASYGWDRESLVYLNRKQYLSGTHVFDGVERLKQNRDNYIATFGVTEPKLVLGVALMSAMYASDLIGGAGLVKAGAKIAVKGASWAAGKVAARRAAHAEAAGRVVSASRWSRTSFQGNRVYQRTDLIDPTRIDRSGMTSMELMRAGRPPVGPDGKAVILHHMLQEQAGPIAEVTTTMHQQFHRILHINPSSIPSGINRGVFGTWRSAYWMWRATGF